MGTRILVVEDEPDIATLLTIMLEMAGYEVCVAESLGGARRLLTMSPPPALTVLDLVLPDGNGLDLCPLLEHSWPGHPVLAVTAMADPRVTSDASAVGCRDVILKPFDPDVVLGRVAQRLREATRGGAAPESELTHAIVGA